MAEQLSECTTCHGLGSVYSQAPTDKPGAQGSVSRPCPDCDHQHCTCTFHTECCWCAGREH